MDTTVSQRRNRSRNPKNQPLPPPPAPQSGRLKTTGKRSATIWKTANANGLVAVVAVIVAVFAYINQATATTATIRAGQASAASVQRHDAEQVTYYPETVPGGKNPQLVIRNASSGLISNVFLLFPVPAVKTAHGYRVSTTLKLTTGFSGDQMGIVFAYGGKQGFIYYSLPDIPPCTVETTRTFETFKDSSIGTASLNGSLLDFTDPNGLGWQRYGSYGKLVRMPHIKPRSEFSWSPFVRFKPATDCS